MVSELWVVCEVKSGRVKRVAFEILGKLKEYQGDYKVAAVIIGSSGEPAAELKGYAVDTVYSLEAPALENYTTLGYTKALVQLIRERNPRAVFFGASIQGRDLSARTAARLGVGLAADCTAFLIGPDSSAFTRPIYAGKALATVELTGEPLIASIRPNTFPVPEPAGGEPEIVTIKADVSAADLGVETVAREVTAGDTVELTEADIIISGGKGMQCSENFEMLFELAELVEGAVGASRSAVDAQWIEHTHQVGQTGKTVSPKIYIACGISGAIQHLAGMSSSKKIIAINKNPDAPIFEVADYGVVADLFEVIPELIEELKRAKAE